MDIINQTARDFGFGQPTGIDLEAERTGELIDSASYNHRFRKRGGTGPGAWCSTFPSARARSPRPCSSPITRPGLGNGKYIFKPHFIKEVRDRAGNVVASHQPEVLHELNMTEEQHQAMLKAMEAVVTRPTERAAGRACRTWWWAARPARPRTPTAGKTHALFIGVAPLYQPELAIAVVFENVGHGGSLAAPIAGAIFRHYFKRKMAGEKQQVL